MTYRICVPLFALVLLALPLSSQEPPDPFTPGEPPPTEEAPAIDDEPTVQDVEAIHDELRALKATMEQALNERDVDTMVANVHPEVVFTTMNGDVVRGPDAIRAYFEKMMVGEDRIVDDVHTEFEVDALSILHGDDTAIAYGSSQDHYELTRGGTFDVTARWSTTMVLWEGRWVVASFHYSTNMFDNPILDAQRRLLLGAGALVGVALGALGFWWGRRSAVGRR